VWKLPVLFVVENNLYGEATPYEFVTPVRDLADRAASYAMPCAIVDGMDFFAVHAQAGEAVARARRGEGPTLLECKTYRYFGHYVGDPLTYRTKEETEAQRGRDPLVLFETRLVDDGLLDSALLRALDGQVAESVADAVGWAKESPLPSPEDLATDVYVRA
jgi:pyruvate dehydrogenase E1 component alpha subunit